MNYGLALSGGGTRGAAHVGVLIALEEEGLLPSSVSGTSAGSIVAGMYAAGITPAQMKDIVHDFTVYGGALIDPDFINIIRLLPQLMLKKPISLTGIIKGNRLRNFFCDVTKGVSFADIPMPVVIPAVDINKGDTITFTNIKNTQIVPGVIWDRDMILCDAMIASASVPGIFMPRMLKDYCLVDGGVTNNLPVNLLQSAGIKDVIAVDIGVDYKMPHSDSIVEIVSHSFSIMSSTLKDCHSTGEILNLKPDLPEGAGLLTFDLMEQCMEAGYEYTKKMIPCIKKSLKSASNRLRAQSLNYYST